jgi:hypothetical protein
VGCVDVDGDGRTELVGLNVTASDDTTVRWSRTVIERDGVQAANGAQDTGTFRRPADDAAIELLFGVSCGEQTLTADGLLQPQPPA